jgi:hypothetical protein
VNNKELKEKLDELRSGLRLVDTIIMSDRKEEGKYSISEKQKDFFKSLIDFFQELNWQLALNEYKEIICREGNPIDVRECGTPVKVRPCGEGYGDKTYFGILIGDVPLSISCSIDEDKNLNISRSLYNPAIFVPELNEIIYGCGSWWGRIDKEEDLKELITEETIKNVWYMKLLSKEA